MLHAATVWRNLSTFLLPAPLPKLKAKYTESCFLKDSRRQFPYLQFHIFQPILNPWCTFIMQLFLSVIP